LDSTFIYTDIAIKLSSFELVPGSSKEVHVKLKVFTFFIKKISTISCGISVIKKI